MSFCPDGKRVATLGNDNTVRIWSLDTGGQTALLKGNVRPLLSMAWSADGNTLATGALDGTLGLWSADGVAGKNYRIGEPGEVLQLTSLSFLPNGRELLYTGIGHRGRAGIFSLDTGAPRLAFDQHTNTVRHGSISTDGRLAVTTGGNDHETFVWHTGDGSVLQKLQGGGQSIWAVGWSPDGQSIAWGNDAHGNTVSAGCRLQRTFRPAELELGDAPTPDFVRIATSRGGYSVEALDFFRVAIKRDGQTLHVFSTAQRGDRIYSLTLLPRDRAVIGASFGMYLLDLASNKVLRTFRGHAGLVLGISPSPDGRYFLTGSTDQTLRIWDPEREDPLLSLFVAGQDWIAWTPEGFYAASAYGERLMGWQINRGLEEMASYYPAVQFHKSLYHPEVIACLLSEGSLARAKARAEKEGGKAAASESVAQVLPPAVTILSPRSGSQSAGAKLEVKAVAGAAGPHPVTACRLLVDGRPYDGDQGVPRFDPPQPGAVEVSWPVELTTGRHVLAVLAESAVSKGLSQSVEVTAAGREAPTLPTLYVLAVGISDYSGELRLKYAAADAESIAAVLKEKTARVFARVEVRLVANREATRGGISEGVAWLGSKMTARDVGIFFFAGHGMRDPGGNFYLVPVDVNPRNPAGTCISGEAIKRALANMPGRLLVLLDACHSGSASQPTAVQRHPRTTSCAIWCPTITAWWSCVRPSAVNTRWRARRSGTAFSRRALVEGLSGKADFNKDRLIHLHELDTYAAARVRQLSRGTQNPVTGRPPTIRSFPLAGL